MRSLRPLDPVTALEWFEQAQIRYSVSVEIRASPEKVFACLADHERWPAWFSSVEEMTPVGSAKGVGARRRVRVPPLIVDEVFIAWEPARRYTFTSTAINLPVVQRLAEDWQLAPTEHGTAVTNVVAADLPTWLRPLRRLIAAGMRRSTAAGPRELKAYLESTLP